MKTKKSIMTMAISLGMIISAMTQVTLGIKGGYHNANVSVPQITNLIPISPKAINGFSLGLFADIPMAGALSFQPELNFVRKGFQISEGTEVNIFGIPVPIGARAITELNYIEVPLLAKIKTPAGPVQAYFAAGPTFAYAASGTLKTKVTALFDWNVTSTDINLSGDAYQRFEVGGMLAGGVEFNSKVGKLFVEGRYSHGFTDMLDDKLIDLKLKNKGFGIQVGVATNF